MPSYSDGEGNFFLNEFDETLDHIMLDVASLAYQNKPTSLNFYINSEGGDATQAFALVELIEVAKGHGHDVYTYVLSEGHSAASMVAIAGSPGKRRTSSTASYLLHYGEPEWSVRSPVELERAYVEGKRHFRRIEDLYATYTKMDREQIRQILAQDQYHMSGEDAVVYGLADDFLV